MSKGRKLAASVAVANLNGLTKRTVVDYFGDSITCCVFYGPSNMFVDDLKTLGLAPDEFHLEERFGQYAIQVDGAGLKKLADAGVTFPGSETLRAPEKQWTGIQRK